MLPVGISLEPDSGGRLLVVDDEVHIAAAIADYFSEAGCVVDCATGAAAAIALLEEFDYSAVVTDLRLTADGSADGLEVVAHARWRQPWAACIVLTAYVDADSARAAEQRGADALLQKPAPLSSVAERIAQILGRGITVTRG